MAEINRRLFEDRIAFAMKDIASLINKRFADYADDNKSIKCDVNISGINEATKKILEEMANARGYSSVTIKTEYGELNIEINLPF